MDEIVGMTVPPPLPSKNQTRDLKQAAVAVGQQTVSIQTVSFPSPLSKVVATGATVLIGGSAPVADSTATCSKDCVPEVQSDNVQDWQKSIECPQQHVVKIKINPEDENSKVISSVRLNLDETPIDSKIRNNYECSDKRNGVVLVCAASHAETKNDGCVRISIINNKNNINNDVNLSQLEQYDKNEMIQRNSQEGLLHSSLSNNSNCFYYGSFQNTLTNMVISSGQCSPSDTLDSGTCSDLDVTPPPLPKKSCSTILLSEDTSAGHNNHHRTGSLTSSGADPDSDENDNDVEDDNDNQSNISCDSLNSGESPSTQVNGIANGEEKGFEAHQLTANFNAENNSNDVKAEQVAEVDRRTKAHHVSTKLDILLLNDEYDSNVRKGEHEPNDVTSYLSSTCNLLNNSRSSSATFLSKNVTCIARVSTPSPTENVQQTWSPIVRECTYEERNQEQEASEREKNGANYYSNYNNSISSTKYVYDDDRFYKFHLHERCCDDKSMLESMVIGGSACENDKENEHFAGYKISEREAIRSAKGTVRGVKNRVRAGIATFLQKPSTKVCYSTYLYQFHNYVSNMTTSQYRNMIPFSP